jgi:predicted CXXCH cytochrome family protein
MTRLRLVAAISGLVLLSPLAPAGRLAGQQGGQVTQDAPTYGCIVCHADMRRAFAQGAHAERGIRCHTCHGGDPSQVEVAAAHRGRFLGVPSKRATAELCASCHADPNQMRQYGLSADQLAEFRASRHGELLLDRGNDDAPTCTDCHEAHTIRPANDARSMVYPTNIPRTCGRCHDDAALMRKYGLSVDQLSRFMAGAHGKAVFEDRNFAAPTCIGCHGSHAALPPNVTETAHVCGKCHVLLADALYAGPHGTPSLSGSIPGCLGCHTNHGTERLPPEQISELCVTCHAAESSVATLGQEIEEQVLHARGELELAAEAITRMVNTGRDVSDERFRYRAAFTAYQQLAKVQHSLDLQQLEDLGREVRSNAAVVRSTAEAYAEERWEHNLLLLPVWFLTLSGLAFAAFKLRELGRASHG